jgi:hypothetical protein
MDIRISVIPFMVSVLAVFVMYASAFEMSSDTYISASL